MATEMDLMTAWSDEENFVTSLALTNYRIGMAHVECVKAETLPYQSFETKKNR